MDIVTRIRERRIREIRNKSFADFWNKPDQWPRPTATHVFLASAVLEIGQAMFGSAWTGDETRPPPEDSERTLSPDVYGDRLRVHSLLLKARTDYVARPSRPIIKPVASGGAIEIPDYELTNEEFATAAMLIEEARRPLLRFNAARDKMVELATFGVIKTAYRPNNSVQLALIDPDVWSVINIETVFQDCRCNPWHSDRYASASHSADVFVERASLEAYIATSKGSPDHPMVQAQDAASSTNASHDSGLVESLVVTSPGHPGPSGNTSRPLTDKIILGLVVEYFSTTKSPTKSGIENFVAQRGFVGNRKSLRKSFDEEAGRRGVAIQRGRPKK